MEENARGGLTLYSRAEAARIVRVTATRLREFERMDLVRPTAGAGSEAAFDFRDLLSLRALVALLERGVSMRRIRRSIARVRQRWPELERPVGALQLHDGAPQRLVVRDQGSLLDPDGQLLLDFAAEESSAPVAPLQRAED